MDPLSSGRRPTGHATPLAGRALLLVLLTFVVLLLGACSRPHEFNGTVYDPVIPAADFTGTNWDGTPFRLSDLRDKVVLLFFGYTSCPDVCPTNLADMKAVKARLGEKAQDIAVVFVTVDPERDTSERMGAYVQAFDPSFYGVTLSPDELEKVKKAYGVFAQKQEVDPAQSAAAYLVDHTAWTYVIDKDGNLRVVFSMDLNADQRVADVAYLISR